MYRNSHTQRSLRAAPRHRDTLIAGIAVRQHGMITTAQLRACGLSSNSITARTRAGRLHRVHRGVYAVGHRALSREARWMAAVLAVGDGAVLGRRSAAELWNVRRRAASQTEIVSPRRSIALRGVHVECSRSLPSRDVTRHLGIPVTSVARTIVDLAEVLTPHQLANVISEAAFRRRLNLPALRAVMAGLRTRRHHATAERALRLYLMGSVGTRSELEDRLLDLVLAAGIAEPVVNGRVSISGGDLEVDFVWPSARVCVEVDGSGHNRPPNRRGDALRDQWLAAAGYRVLRFTGTAVERRGSNVVARIRAAIGAGM